MVLVLQVRFSLLDQRQLSLLDGICVLLSHFMDFGCGLAVQTKDIYQAMILYSLIFCYIRDPL